MPGIVVFRRRWSVGSDDLVVPGVFLFVLHLIWVIVLGVLLGVLEWDRSVSCVLLLWEYVLGYLVILAVSIVVDLSISILAMRGSILDTAKRAPMQYFLYFRLLVMLVEVGWLCAGIAWLVTHYRTCPVDQAKDFILGLVISNWCVLASVLVTVWCTFDAAGRSWVKMKKYQRSMREAESRGGGRLHYKRSGSTNRNWRQRKVIRAYQDSWDNRCRLLFCCIGNSDRNRNSFADIARLLSDFFRDLDVVPSDVVAGLVLLRKFQKIERELIVKQNKNDTYEFLSGVPVTPRTKFLALTEDSPDLGHFQAAIHYMHFALAAYGWPIFLYTHSTGLCQLCTRLRCGCFPCGSHEDEATVVEDNCCQCNYAALRRMVEVGEVEVVYATYHVDVGETPFFVALDYTRKKVVVSIRGTLSMKDVMTDLNAEAEVIPLTPPRDDWLGHKGMVHAAEYIRKKIHEEGIITRALAKDPTRGTHQFGLTLVGHSLGAGTAAILAILMRQEYPDLVCFSFAPPGGLLSMPAQQHTQEFITSVVYGKDVVPRLGLRQMESLRADLINAIKRSVDPKWKTIACSVMCCGCTSTPTSAANLEAGGCISEYQRDKDQARCQTVVPSDSRIALTLHRPLYPPGRIIHVVRHHPNKSEQKYESRWRQVLRKREPVFQALWADPRDFDEVLISPVMIQDHMPDKMLNALKKVSTQRSCAVIAQPGRRQNTPVTRSASVKPGEYEPLENAVDGPEVVGRIIDTDEPPVLSIISGDSPTLSNPGCSRTTNSINAPDNSRCQRPGNEATRYWLRGHPRDLPTSSQPPSSSIRLRDSPPTVIRSSRSTVPAISLPLPPHPPSATIQGILNKIGLGMPRFKVITTLGPAKPQRTGTSGHTSSAEASEVREVVEIQEVEIEQEMRALLSPPSPAKVQTTAGTPPHRLCLETSFTSLQSPTEFPQGVGNEPSIDSRGLPWEYVSLGSELTKTPRAIDSKLSCQLGGWDNIRVLAPLATPETLSEASSDPPSPVPPPRPMRRTPKIPGNLSTAADDMKNNLHFAMLSAKNYFLKEETSSSNSSGNSEASYESAKSLGPRIPPPVPRRRDSVIARREHRVCTAACCRDDISENSSSPSSRISHASHRVRDDFAKDEHDTNGSSLDFYEAQDSFGQRESSNEVFLSVRSSPECKGLMTPAIDLGVEWKRKFDAPGLGGDASLPLLHGLAPTPTHAQHNSPFFNAKRKKYVYPITMVGRGESSV